MNKRICDICDKNVANNNFRIRQRKCFADYDMGFVLPRWEWVEIDICDECFEKMKTIKDYKKLEDRIYDEAITGWSEKYGDDEVSASNYLAGVEAACRAINPNIQFDAIRTKINKKVE